MCDVSISLSVSTGVCVCGVSVPLFLSEAANLDVFFFLDFGHFLVLLET